MSTISEENSIFDFEVSDNEIDMAKLVPKLKDASNWRKWDAQMNEIKMSPAPIYENPSHNSVKALLFKEAKANKDKEIHITEDAIEARSIQVVTSNLELRKHHADGKEKWERANNRAFLQFVSTLGPEALSMVHHITNVREVYLELKDVYWNPSHIATYRRVKKFVNLRCKRGDSYIFVMRFNKALGKYTAFVGNMTPMQEPNHFKRAVPGNPRCRVFILNLTMNEEDPDLMDQVYQDFVVAVRVHQMFSRSL
ncbi:hypothetical protein N7536_003640 [Penicillium majusculum]|nr:hypothetical protein N7536_003640 [Penicillium majusculum]